MDKKEIRLKLKSKLSSVDRCTYEQDSYVISKQLFSLSQWNHADTIAVTISRFPEVDTWQIIRRGWNLGKRMVVPKCLPKTKEMVFREITAFTQLESVFFGLFEPIENITSIVHKNDIDLIIVPGIAFDRKGYRIGFGGGYYDRFLENFTGDILSLGFSPQIQHHLPVEKHDIPVHAIITESGLIDCK